MDIAKLRAAVREEVHDIPDFPKAGIIFRDIMPLFANVGLSTRIARWMAAGFVSGSKSPCPIDAVVCIEARGFLLGPLVAQEIGVGLIPVRKAGKLPGETLSRFYNLEYGRDLLEIQADACKPGQRVLLVDDVLATGGTAEAACRLIERSGGSVDSAVFLIELDGLGGSERLSVPIRRLLALPA